MIEINSNVGRIYSEFLTVLHQAGRYGKPNKANLNRIFGAATGEKNTNKDIQFREGMRDHAMEASVILATERIQSHYFIAKKVFNHMVTEKSSNCEEYTRMKRDHDKAVAPFHKKPTTAVGSDIVIPRNHEVSALVNILVPKFLNPWPGNAIAEREHHLWMKDSSFVD